MPVFFEVKAEEERKKKEKERKNKKSVVGRPKTRRLDVALFVKRKHPLFREVPLGVWAAAAALGWGPTRWLLHRDLQPLGEKKSPPKNNNIKINKQFVTGGPLGFI